MKTQLLLMIIPFILTSCVSNQTKSKKPDYKIISISIPEIQNMLSSKLTRKELEKRLGSPINQDQGNWGNLMYELPDKKYLFFFFKGPYITEAKFDKIEIKGIEPKTYKMNFIFNSKEQRYLPSLDNEVFEDIDSFKKHLRKLPGNSIIEWQHECDITKVKKPIETTEQIKSFEDFCLKQGIILIQYPAG